MCIRDSIHYYQDELVWAKIKGFSWWPGVVSSVDKGRDGMETQITVNFVGENSHAVLTLDKVMKYREGYAQCSQTKKRSLLDAIETANRIEAGATTYIDEKEKLKKKGKVKQAVDKKGSESKKRKMPEKSLETPAGNTRSTPKSAKQNQVEKKAPPVISSVKEGFYLKRTQNFFKKLATQNPKVILAKRAKVEESLKEISSESITVTQLQESKLGFDLQLFVNTCRKAPSLSEISSSTQMVLNKLKQDALLSLFGGEDNSTSNHDTDKKSDDAEPVTFAKTKSGKSNKGNNNKVGNAKGNEEMNKSKDNKSKDSSEGLNDKLNEDKCATSKQPESKVDLGEPEKIQEPAVKMEDSNKEVPNNNDNGDNHVAEKANDEEIVHEVSDKLEEQKMAVESPCENPVEKNPASAKTQEVREESGQRWSGRVAKEPAMMLIVCREIARLLEEVRSLSA
eukprot:TRINITY_DN4806_c0_g1_i3.p1 TRINITY_DN4806_c0_g1~~TRINITY_DN4806_c0_g1_i3.p1  ORF type:complete len:452 (-),score=117.35 TRINITY_DN4806_c0_g1_i3:298-1653(-)